MLGNLFGSQKSNGQTQVVGQVQTTQTSVVTEPSLPIPIVPVTVISTTTTPVTPTASVLAAPSLPTGGPSTTGASMDPTRREDLSALSHLDSRAMQVLAHSQQESVRIKQAQIMTEQVLIGLLYDEEIFKLLGQFSVDVAKLSRELQQKETIGNFSGQSTLSDQVKQVFEAAFNNAKDRGSSFISPEDILISLFSSNLSSILTEQGVQKDTILDKLSKSTTYSEGGRKSVLEKYGVDLTAKAKAGELDPVAGRDREIDRIQHILLRRTKNNPIIIGEAGVGKTAIIEGLAQQIVNGTTAKDLRNKRIIQLDVTSLVAGASHRGEFEERLRSVIRDVMVSAGQIILFIDEIHTLIGTGDSDGAMDASNILKPNLARGQLQVIGTTTTAEYRKYFEKDKAFARRFQPIICDEPDEENALKMMQVIKGKYEKFHDVAIPDDALKAAVQLSKKYIGERFLPDKAVDLLDEASADVRLQNTEGKRTDKTVLKSDIENVVSAWTGIPITKLTEDESAKLLELEDRIHQRLIDQEQAVGSVSEAVRRGRIGLASANRPIASFIFLGPTGTGKTELAKTLAEILFGRDDALIRLDMSEYMEKHEVAKLIGAPPGYVGYEEGGQLTEAVRAKPYSIVLLDEVEKAHPDVFNILLQLLEDGRLTDNKGNTISFKNTIVIATSNIGSQLIQDELSKPITSPEEFQKEYDVMQEKVSGELHKFFRPELLNRFDEIVMFKPLRQEDMKFIADLGIKKTGKLLKDQGFELKITDAALEVLSKEGYDPSYGARPLRRLIQSNIENPIAMLLIKREFVSGDTIQIDYDVQKSEFTFIKLTPQPVVDQTVPVAAAVPPVSNPTGTPTPPLTSASNIVHPEVPASPMPTPLPAEPAAEIAVPYPKPQIPEQPIIEQPIPASTPAPVVADVPSDMAATVQSAVAALNEADGAAVDQVLPTPPTGVNAYSFSPPAVSVPNLLNNEEETLEFA